MKTQTLSRGLRTRVPQTVRVRLTLLYAGLFLGAGAVLLALTYGLLAGSLPKSTAPLSAIEREKATLACKATSSTLVNKDGLPVRAPVPKACTAAYRAGATQAVDNQRNQTLHNLLLFSLIGLGVMTIASGGLGWVMARRVLRPVTTITDAARRASERHLGERIALQGPNDELKQLADTFDDMLARLDSAFASQKRFVADASHELRTPLTVMRTALDVTLAKADRSPEQLDAMAAKVRRSLDQAEALIDALLTLAVSERRAESAEFVDLATVAEDLLEGLRPEASSAGLRVHADLDPAETNGNETLLERLVGNLLDNAIRYNVSGGWVSVRTGTSAGRPFVEVANSGPSVAGEMSELFEPFRRANGNMRSGDGFGLGLAIVRSICVSHGAELEATARAEGGLRVSVVMPLSSEV